MTKARDLANAATALSAVNATELGYLDGVTSAVQTQINTKAGTSAPTLTGTVVASGDINLTAAGGPGSLIDELTLIINGAI
jgi:hypothetical protein